ncbi:hypothetical protein P4O66_006946, partial [Electrophorus voltai]
MWEGIQAITNYRKTSPSCDSNASLSDALNDFFARFEAQNNIAVEKSIPPQNDQVLCLTAADVRRTLRGVNPRNAAGPDNIPGRVLRECADQLADVLTDIFNISLSCTVVPTCFKTTTIVPVPKKPTVSCLNDYRPIALTSIIMKCFGRLVMRHIKTQLPPSLDPLQFAYHSNRSTDDAISTTLHPALTHLDKKGTYVRMLFIDFSSAFNTIVPQHLIGKLSLLGFNTSLCNWILDFLTGRPHLNHIIKFADDTIVVGLINKDDESAYREEVRELRYYREHPEQLHHYLLFDRKTFHKIVRTVEKIIGVSLPSITDIYTTRCIRKATSIVEDPTHPSHELFTLLPSGR